MFDHYENIMATLTSGVPAHIFTNEERSRGGQAIKYNNLRHGRYADKLSQTYICPECQTPIPAGSIKEQDAIIAKLATKQGVYEALKADIVRMEQCIDEESDRRVTFAMLKTHAEQLFKLWERTPQDLPLLKIGDDLWD
jgi:hypothetical protein